MGRCKAACSALRLLYLAIRVARKLDADIMVLDVLPQPLFIWQWISNAALLFYCHFPDLLLQQQNSKPSSIKRIYRSVLNGMEEHSMLFADEILVNSKFTRRVVKETFPRLATRNLQVLYPALDAASLKRTKSSSVEPLIVSLNRYERKKAMHLVIEAAAWMQDRKKATMPRIVIAGGYDKQCIENVDYHEELKALAKANNVKVEFQRSISDTERSNLLSQATAVLYTPSDEHFGIVPIEVMYSETVVIANRSGGPEETVVDGVTGILCSEPTAEEWGKALETVLLMDPGKQKEMGQAGRKRVEEHFSEDRLCHQWTAMVEEAVVKGRARLDHYQISPRTYLYVLEALLSMILYFTISFIVKAILAKVVTR